MEITIKAEPKEIAALVKELEGRQEKNVVNVEFAKSVDIEKINTELGERMNAASRGHC